MKQLLYATLCCLVIGCTIKTVDPASSSSGSSSSTPPVNTTVEPCIRDKFGWLRFNNTSNNPYDVSIDGVYWGRVPGKTVSAQVKASSRSYKLYAKQVSGYLVYATEREKTVSIVSCSEYMWEFP